MARPRLLEWLSEGLFWRRPGFVAAFLPAGRGPKASPNARVLVNAVAAVTHLSIIVLTLLRQYLVGHGNSPPGDHPSKKRFGCAVPRVNYPSNVGEDNCFKIFSVFHVNSLRH